MGDLSSRGAAADPRAILAEAGLRAKKSWGQNFLRDAALLDAIATATGAGPAQPILELGAGLGALTRALLARGGHVVAVERDRELVPILRYALGENARLEIMETDAARLNYAELASAWGGALVVAGNLPYQLSGRILVALADAREAVAAAVLMVQREVAARLTAQPGGRAYGLLSVLVQRTFALERLRDVPPAAFHPPPKVHSSIVRLTRHAELRPAECDARLVAAARAGFSARRKTLRNALVGALGQQATTIEAALREAGISPGARAETLGLHEFAALGDALRSCCP